MIYAGTRIIETGKNETWPRIDEGWNRCPIIAGVTSHFSTRVLASFDRYPIELIVLPRELCLCRLMKTGSDTCEVTRVQHYGISRACGEKRADSEGSLLQCSLGARCQKKVTAVVQIFSKQS